MFSIRTQPSLNRDFTLLSLIIIAMLLLISVRVVTATLDNYRHDVLKEMESESLRLDRALIVEIENASYILESIGRQIQTTGVGKQESIAQLFYSFAKTTGTKRMIFSWTDTSQMLTISSNLGVMKEPIDVSDRDYLKKSIAEPWKVHIGRPIYGRLSDKWVLPLSLGLTDGSGTYVGSVVVALDTVRLTDEIGKTLKDSGVRFAITNTALTLLTRSKPSEEFFAKNFDIHAISALDFDAHPSGEYSRGALLAEEPYTYYERSSQYPYIIFLGVDPKKSKEMVIARLVPRLLQLCVIAVFLLFILSMVRWRIIRPVVALTAQTAGILRGERFEEEKTTGPLEIEQLGHEIKRLFDYLDERRRVESELRLKNAELHRIKQAAQLTNQVKAEFFAFIGQELTEPVEVILEQIETIKDQQFGPLGNPIYGQHAFEVHEHATQLLSMLADIKAISEAETGLLALNESEIDLGFILQKTVRIFRDKNLSSIEAQLDVPVGLPQLRGDELRLKQMVLNILNASARHLAPGDVIRISTSMKAQELSLVFSYASTLSGEQARMKALGSPLAISTTRNKHGLELALARLLVAMHQGTLEMKTTSDRTTMITVKFPAARLV